MKLRTSSTQVRQPALFPALILTPTLDFSHETHDSFYKLCKNWTYFISFISASLHCSMISFPLAFCVLAAYSTIVRKHKQIQDQQEQIQRLKSAAIEMRDEQLQLIRDKQKQQHLEELSAEITARMEALTTEIRVLFIYLLLLFIYLFLFLCKWKQIFNVAVFSSDFVVEQEGNEELCPLSAALEKLQQEKQKLVEQKKQREEEEQKKVDAYMLY